MKRLFKKIIKFMLSIVDGDEEILLKDGDIEISDVHNSTVTINGRRVNQDDSRAKLLHNGKFVKYIQSSDVTVHVIGNLSSLRCVDAEIKGNITGDVRGTSLNITGDVGGNVNCTSLDIKGNIKGNVKSISVNF